MAKFNLRVFKKGKPIYWIIGAVVVFVAFYMLFNRGGSSASGTTVIQSGGMSEQAQLAAAQIGAANQQAQLAASIELARVQGEKDAANLGAQVALAQLASGETVALSSLERESAIAAMNVNANLLMNEQNINYATESARIAAETQLGLREIDTNLLREQMRTQSEMFAVQSHNLIAQSVIGQIGNLKKKNRDEALIAISEGALGTTLDYTPRRGGFNPLKLVSPIANAI